MNANQSPFSLKAFSSTTTWLGALQWLIFMFTNTVVIPITLAAAFDLPASSMVMLMQISFVLVGAVCVVQGLFGHGRPVMEGQSGLWWAVILSLAFSAPQQGMSLVTLGGSLAIGILISGVLTVLIGLSGIGFHIARLFNPGVMGVFMFLFGVKLMSIFLKGMLGLPFGEQAGTPTLDVGVTALSIFVVIVVTLVAVRTRAEIARYALLIGLIVGWLAWIVVFPDSGETQAMEGLQIEFFPLGAPIWDTGVVLTAVLTGILNLANTFGALKGTEPILDRETTRRDYRRSLTTSGVWVGLSGLFGVVPFAPYVSSIGFLQQTGILTRLPFVLGGVLFVLMGLIPPVGEFFSMLPLSIGSAILFAPYLLLFNSALLFFKQIKIETLNTYRVSIPLFVGIVFMTFPPDTFNSLPQMLRPLISNGLLMGIILALILENTINWDKYAQRRI